ncbi:hypothetical protein CC80DRAFT_563311 [Byssothecium circinans]|uniref:Reverse transcriptase domain-containing protein n=1 Tax=Byssothecium circinans TaxID=147558 RepID=A0A6A5TUW9_9PLEO|nr:hypothetical protein CC80DRAFT_563311 [Byssothecium circinans]
MASLGGSGVYAETLYKISTSKFMELSKQRVIFEFDHYRRLLDLASAETDPLKRLSLLADGAKACFGVQTASSGNGTRGDPKFGSAANSPLESDLMNLDRFLEQARYDPSVSPNILHHWEESIRKCLSVQLAKYHYAELYNRLIIEWLASEKSGPADGDMEMTESSKEFPDAKKMEVRTEWEKTTFDWPLIDTQRLEAYLQRLFITDNKYAANSIRRLRSDVRKFEASLDRPHQFTIRSLAWVIEGLQASSVLSNEKREALTGFLKNDVILAEIANVLNLRIKSLGQWTWALSQWTGRPRPTGTADILQAIFLHYVGVKWSVFFKKALVDFHFEASTSKSADIPGIHRKRRQYYLDPSHDGTVDASGGLQSTRAKLYVRDYLANQLLDSDAQRNQVQEGEEEVEFTDYSAERPRKRARQETPKRDPRMSQLPQPAILNGEQPRPYHVDDPEESHRDTHKTRDPMQAKQNRLSMLSTEIIINTHLHGELTCFQSVFESWNPLLPHETITTVLDFFGVSFRWLYFFQTFLGPPLKFNDDPASEPRLRRRGTPGSHTLGDVFGEVVLACLDFAVNQATDGGLLHRVYDDICFWSKDYEKCTKAWASVLEFSAVMGVKINESKSGSGDIRWGFLYLDPSTGRFEIDEDMVTDHIEKLRKQLKGTNSVIAWIQAWNTYTTFISSNFGKAANCFGRQHVDKMLATYRHIEESIFDGGNVVQFLKQMIAERFDVKDISDGFLYFPVELGGLALKSPYVGLLQIRQSVKAKPNDMMKDYLKVEREDYEYAAKKFDRADPSKRDFQPEHPYNFFSYREFIRYREEFSPAGEADLVRVYRTLLKQPVAKSIAVNDQLRLAIVKLKGQVNPQGIIGEWNCMDPYWQWIVQMYGPEMLSKFGGLKVVDQEVLPLGMVSLLRQNQVKVAGLE